MFSLFVLLFLPPFVAVTSRKIIWNGHWCWRRLKGSSRQRQPWPCCTLTPIPSYCRTGESLAQSTEQSVYTLPVLSSAEYGVWRACGVCLGWGLRGMVAALYTCVMLCKVYKFCFSSICCAYHRRLENTKETLTVLIRHALIHEFPPPYTQHTHTHTTYTHTKLSFHMLYPPKHPHTHMHASLPPNITSLVRHILNSSVKARASAICLWTSTTTTTDVQWFRF